MRKIYLAFAAFVVGSTSMAQNLDFEAGWSAFPITTVANYMIPDDWFGTTQQLQPGANSTANALKLETENDPTFAALLGGQGITITNNNVAGYGLYEQGIGGAAFPISVDFYYQFAPVNNDTAAIVLVNVIDTMAAGTSDDVTLAQGVGLYTQTQAAWTMTSVPLTVFATGTHHIIEISAYSSPKDFVTGLPFTAPDPEDGTAFHMDEISLVGNMASIDENTEVYEINAYPNPASDNFRIELPDSRTRTISIMGMTGQVLKTIAVNNMNVNVNVSDLDNGVYFYQLKDGSGDILTTRKMVVKK